MSFWRETLALPRLRNCGIQGNNTGAMATRSSMEGKLLSTRELWAIVRHVDCVRRAKGMQLLRMLSKVRTSFSVLKICFDNETIVALE